MRRMLQRFFCDQMAAWSVLCGRPRAAMRWYRRMLAVDPDDVLALSSLAYRCALAGDRGEAVALFDRVARLRPGDAELHFNRGYLLQEAGDHDAAIEAFAEAIRCNDRHDRAHYGMALSLIATRRLDAAVAPLTANTRLQPMSPYGWYQLARLQRDRGEVGEAQRILDRLAQFEPRIAGQLARETGLVARPP